MSADNWAECPRCMAELAKKNAAELEELAADYGVMPAAEYTQKAAEISERHASNITNENLREDYEYSVNGAGLFFAYYKCCCDCGFSFTFKHEEAVPLDDE